MTMDTSFLDGVRAEDEDQASLFATAALNDLQSRVFAFQEAVAGNNLLDAAQYAHAMKSVAANVGAEAFSALAKQAEDLCKDGNADGQLSNISQNMVELFSEIEETLKGYIKSAA